MVNRHSLQFVILSLICILSYYGLQYKFRHDLIFEQPLFNITLDNKQKICTQLVRKIRETRKKDRVQFIPRYSNSFRQCFVCNLKFLNTNHFYIFLKSKPLHHSIENNTKNHGLLIYNKVAKTGSTTIVDLLSKLSVQNNFTHLHVPIIHYFNTTISGELRLTLEKLKTTPLVLH